MEHGQVRVGTEVLAGISGANLSGEFIAEIFSGSTNSRQNYIVRDFRGLYRAFSINFTAAFIGHFQRGFQKKLSGYLSIASLQHVARKSE